MKKKILALTVLATSWFTNTAIAQNLTAGVPVHQQIINLPVDIEVTAECDSLNGQEAELYIPLPVVTGVSYYVHVDNAIPTTDSFKVIHNGITKILSLGDSMLIISVATTTCCEIIKLSYSGPVPQVNASYASLKFMAVGTPTVAGENYPYSPCDAWFNQGIGCIFPHYVAEIDILTGDTCYTITNTVQSPTSIDRIDENFISVYPNPTSDLIYIDVNANLIGQPYQLYDNLGRQILSGTINSPNSSINIVNLPGGLYLLSLGDHNKRLTNVLKN